jgi:1,4-dihydroxy-6-naphthoate synthase
LKTITLAYSPDTDDAFMVRAMQEGRVDLRGYRFEYTSADIQVLNEAASHGTYDVTAISVAAYPSLADQYLLMPVGASVGDDFGPAIIVRNGDGGVSDVKELRGKKIAVPGLRTTAFFAARGLIGEFTAVPMHFMEIGPAVAAGAVDAGILIHELQIDCERHGFKKLGDLGKLWHAAHGLPLPLGANAIKRSLGAGAIREINAVYRESIEVGLATREETLKSALAASKADLDLQLGDRYISMYVNDRSLRFERDALEAAGKLFAIGAAAGLCPALAPTGWFVD